MVNAGSQLNQPFSQNEVRTMLRWLVDAGADEALAEAPIDRFSVPPPLPAAGVSARSNAPAPLVQRPSPSSAATVGARQIAASCTTLAELRAAVDAFEGCELRKTAKSTVFADGPADAAVMFIGEAPGREEDLEGLPFVGPSGQLLNRMLAAIGLDRASNAYIANVIFWRPPGNRTPTPEEMAICDPFLRRHIELKQPKVLVLLGGTPMKHILNIEDGITRIRGKWRRYGLNGQEIPVLPMFHPSYLLHQPSAKRQAWQDLLSLKLKLRELGVT
jgi:DNA polymerase